MTVTPGNDGSKKLTNAKRVRSDTKRVVNGGDMSPFICIILLIYCQL